MTLDLAALRAKLNEVQKGSNNVFFKPEEGNQTIRIVPLSSNLKNPFQTLFFHYGLNGKTYLSPRSYDETDPIADFSDSLISEGNLSKDDYKAAKKFSPTARTYLPIVVRGKEKEGVKFWAFGKNTLEDILKIMTAEDEHGELEFGDITDVKEGRDITVTFVPQEKSDTSYAKTSILPKGKASALTTDKELLKKLLENQPVLLDAFTKVSSADLETALRKHLKADDESESETNEVVEEKSTPAEPVAKINPEFEQEFNELFNS